MSKGEVYWESMKKLQVVYRGRKPVKVSTIVDENGCTLTNHSDVCARWQHHFLNVLNVPSNFQEDVVNSMIQLPVRDHLDGVPGCREVQSALNCLKCRKAAGESGILPELLLCGGSIIIDKLVELFELVWRDGCVVGDWCNALIVPIPKKGNLTLCDNWRGISLLDVVGKVLGRIVQDRLRVVAEDVLPDSQCGFRADRGCIDMIFVARQLVEKAREHQSDLFVLFIDLKKAYDSVPRPALWGVLENLGVPSTLVSIIRSFHEGMSAKVIVGQTFTEPIGVCNGLRQGCTMAPVLFSLYFGAVVDDWRSKCLTAGVEFRHKLGRKLVGDRSAKSRLLLDVITESQVADDAALYATSEESWLSHLWMLQVVGVLRLV